MIRRLLSSVAIAAIAGAAVFVWSCNDPVHDAQVDALGAEPAGETINALKPGLATTRGLLLAISSPYARRGALFSAYDRNFGKDGAPALVWQDASREMNAAAG